MGFAGAFVFIEPSPYEFIGFVTIFFFGLTGLSLRPALAPLIVLLMLLNAGYVVALMQVIDDTTAAIWVLVSVFLAVSAIFFAAMLGTNTEARLNWLLRGYVAAAVIASLVAIAAYFRLFGSWSDAFMLYERARGTFKDPNVFGAFLVLPGLLAFERVLAGRLRAVIASGMLLLVMLAALLLTFSRGAWGQFLFAALLMMGMNFLTSRSANARVRIALIAMLGTLVLAVFVVALLSIDKVAELFKERASLEQSYDVGHFGRFGRYILGAELALDHPVRDRAAAILALLRRGPAQRLPQCLHVGRMACGLRLSDAHRRDGGHGDALRVRRDAVACDLSRRLRRLSRRGRRKPRHRHRPLAPLFPHSGRAVGPDERDAGAPCDRGRQREPARGGDLAMPA